MTVYDRIKSMTKDELQNLIHYIYLWGHINEQCGVDDECFYEHLLNLPARHCDNIIDALDNLQLYQVKQVFINHGEPSYLSTKFFSIEDAAQYLKKYCRDITKIDDHVYMTSLAVYTIIPCK